MSKQYTFEELKEQLAFELEYFEDEKKSYLHRKRTFEEWMQALIKYNKE